MRFPHGILHEGGLTVFNISAWIVYLFLACLRTCVSVCVGVGVRWGEGGQL